MARAKVNWYVSPAKDHHRIDHVVSEYQRYLRSDGLKDRTVVLYPGRVREFLSYAANDDPGPDAANDYRDELIGKKLSRTYINNTCFAIKKFFLMKGTTWTFKVLRPKEGCPFFFDEADVVKIISVCDNIKHKAMLETLFFGCLRSSELCNLDDGDLDLNAKTLRLKDTKNNSDALALINSQCVETLKAYLKVRPKIEVDGRTPLFYTDYLNRWANNDVHRMFVSYKAKAGVKKPGAVHVFSRHTPATLMVAKGCDVRIVMELLRHRDIRTTLRYAHVSDKTRREMHDRYLTL